MLLYEVNIRALSEIADEYEAWLEDHVREIVGLDGFLEAEWFVVEEDAQAAQIEETLRHAMRLDESIPLELREAAAHPIATRTYCVQYRVADRASLDRYLAEEAPRLRQDGIDRFGSKFAASRRVMDLRRVFRSST